MLCKTGVPSLCKNEMSKSLGGGESNFFPEMFPMNVQVILAYTWGTNYSKYNTNFGISG